MKPPRVSLRKQDYPNVKHWEKRHNDAVHFAVVKVYDADSSDCDSDPIDNTGSIAKREGVFAFLEDENGNVITFHERRRLYAELRGFWNDNINPDRPPDNWSSAGATLRDKFRDVLEDKFPFLRLCAGRWKVEALWKKNYHSWKRSLFARQAKRTPNLGGSNIGSKRKRCSSPELQVVDSDGDTEILHNTPQLKKAKMGSVALATTTTSNQFRNVRQFIADSYLIIMKSASNMERSRVLVFAQM